MPHHAAMEKPMNAKHTAASKALQKALRLHQTGQAAEARAGYERILRQDPDNPHALHLLGVLHAQQGDLKTAATLQQRAATLHPKERAFARDLCTTLRRAARWEDCVAACRTGLDHFPDDFDLRFLLAESLYHLARFADIPGLLAAIPSGHPRTAAALFLRANARHELADSDRAMAEYKALLDLVPDMTPARMNLALLHKERGQVEQAFAMYREAAAAHPEDVAAASTALFFRHYIPGSRPADFLAEAGQWAARFTGTVQLAPEKTSRCPAAARTLRVGLVSGDFRAHAVGFFLYPALAALSALCGDRLELHCFSNNPFNDEYTGKFTALARSFTNIRPMDDDRAARHIAGRKLDLLLDLSGLSPNCRPGVMARRPAPVQAVWLGYFNTTGLSAMDWIVADRHVLPLENEPFYTEKALRLPACFFCYPPPGYDIAPAPEPPAQANGYATFGCCNDTAKLNPEVIALWSEILHRTPGSRLLLKSRPLADPAVRRAFAARFEASGIAPERLDLRPASGHRDYYAAHTGKWTLSWTPSPTTAEP